MTYPENIEQKTGFDEIRRVLLSLCSGPLGRERVEAIAFSTDYEVVDRQLAIAREMQTALHTPELGFPRGSFEDVRESLQRVRIPGLYLVEDELAALQKTLSYIGELGNWLVGLDAGRFPQLTALARPDTVAIGQVVRWIDAILDRYGRLSDHASPELLRIRREIHAAQGSVSRALQTILRQAQAEGLVDKDAAPTLREGRLVLPVPPAYKRKIGGIVHDESATGKTVFVEPQQVVEANNRIRELEAEEQRERIRILQELTDRIRPLTPQIMAGSDLLAEVDLLMAKVRLADELKAIAPELVNQPMLDIREGRHPLLYMRIKDGVVPLTLRLGKTKPLSDSLQGERDSRILIISGPNAGGKSVCLKTVALLQYMVQCGLMVPVREDSVFGIYRNLMIDIGDEQSITDDLSTYSSHLRNMRSFVRMADKRSLFLIDEFGTGTEPLIGGAIAEAVLDELLASGAGGVVTTHYTNLKHYADTHEGVVNGAMLYDRGALRPLFQLNVGQAGSSFALEIARSIGLPDSIVRRATELIGEEHIDYDRQLQDIARDKRYWANKREKIHEREKRLETLIAQHEQEMKEVGKKKKEILREAQEQAGRLLQESNATIERTIREIKEAKAERSRTQKARERVEVMKEKVTGNREQGTGNKEPGARSQEPGNKNQKKVMRDFSELRSLGKAMSKAASAANPPVRGGQGAVVDTIRQRKLAFNRTLDIRGMRVDEALETVIAYIDDAQMVQAGQVTILHGTGTGALKQVVRDYLNGYNLRLRRRGAGEIVFHDGDINTGGAGLTVVEL